MGFADYFKSKFSDDPEMRGLEDKLNLVGMKPESPFQKLMNGISGLGYNVAAGASSIGGDEEGAQNYRQLGQQGKQQSIVQQILLKKLLGDPKDSSTNQMKNYAYYMQGLKPGQSPMGFMDFLKSGGGGGGAGNFMVQLGLGDAMKNMFGNAVGGSNPLTTGTAPGGGGATPGPRKRWNKATGKFEVL